MNDLPKPSLRKTARIRDMATNKYLDRIEFTLPSGETGLIELPPSIVNDQALFAKRLLDAGAILPPDRSARKQLLEEIAGSICEIEQVYAARGGWTTRSDAFVRPDRIIGDTLSNIVGFRRSKQHDFRGQLRRKGDVSTWASRVAKPAQSSSVLMFCIAAALAPPLLKFVGKGSFGFCLSGRSRSGKTLATLVAGSVTGNGSTEQLLDWNATDNRLQEQFPEFNDCLVPVDDVMSMKGSDRDKYARIKSVSYILASGAGTARHTNFSTDTNDNWRTIILTSNEISIRELANRSRLEREPGETVRLIDVPATFDGSLDIFDREYSTGDQNWEKWFKACSKNQGYAFESFLRSLIEKKEQARALTKEHIHFFAEFVHDADDGNFARDIAGKFGIVFAAGVLAIQYDLIPWKVDQLKRAVAKCYFAARDLLPDEGVVLRSGKQILKTFLKQLPSKDAIDPDDNSTLSGFQEERLHDFRCLVKREKFKVIFETNTQCQAVENWLLDNNRVSIANSALLKKMKGQHFWPDRQRYRSVEIFWPKKQTDE
jgi:Domain of unknown function (DUF927)